MTVRACSLCQFYVPLGSILTRGSCVRYPTPTMKNDGEWCGEFAGRAAAAVPEVEPKAARGRRLKEVAPSEAGQ